MIGNCTFNIEAINISNNIIINNSETNNLKTIGTTCAVYAMIGFSLFSFAPKNYIDSNNYTQHYDIIPTPNYGTESIFAGMSIDLLKVENINKIYKMKGFENDWNGNGAKKFSDESIKLFIDIIDKLFKQPQIAPTGKGSLLMQYEKGNGSILAFDVALDKVEKVYVPKSEFEHADTEIFTENFYDNMNNCVEWFYEIG